MSKCDLQIVFDRADRVYRGGEQVRGEVCVRVIQDVTCDALRLRQYWQTHGRGNRDRGDLGAIELFRGTWQRGQTYRYPFCLTAPEGPSTYHGTYVNVDHYLKARIVLAWARDVSREEEYLLLPGPLTYPLATLPAARPPAKAVLRRYGVPAGVGLIVIGPIFPFPFNFLLSCLGVFVLVFTLRCKLAEQKIGKVDLRLGKPVVSPGDSLPVSLRFRPRRPATLNGVTARLVGKEVCTSGSGTNRSTYTHQFFQRQLILAGREDLPAGREVHIQQDVPIPDTHAYSFEAKANRVVWELELRIDIPLWPDWVQQRTITVAPRGSAEVVPAQLVTASAAETSAPGLGSLLASLLGATASSRTVNEVTVHRWETCSDAASEPSLAEPKSSGSQAESTAATTVPIPAAERQTSAASEPPAAAPVAVQPSSDATPAGVDRKLLEIVERIEVADRYSRKREQIVAAEADHPFDCLIKVGRVERTYGLVEDDRFRQGRTLTGTIVGTNCKVSLRLSAARNEEVDALKPDDTLHVKCMLSKWNSIYEQLDIREA